MTRCVLLAVGNELSEASIASTLNDFLPKTQEQGLTTFWGNSPFGSTGISEFKQGSSNVLKCRCTPKGTNIQTPLLFKARLRFLGSGFIVLGSEEIGVAIVASTSPVHEHSCCSPNDSAGGPLMDLGQFINKKTLFTKRFGLDEEHLPGARTFTFKANKQLYTRRKNEPELWPLRALFNHLQDKGMSQAKARGLLNSWVETMSGSNTDIEAINLGP